MSEICALVKTPLLSSASQCPVPFPPDQANLSGLSVIVGLSIRFPILSLHIASCVASDIEVNPRLG